MILYDIIAYSIVIARYSVQRPAKRRVHAVQVRRPAIPANDTNNNTTNHYYY